MFRDAARAYLSATLTDNGINPAENLNWLDAETDALADVIAHAVSAFMSSQVAPLPDDGEER